MSKEQRFAVSFALIAVLFGPATSALSSPGKCIGPAGDVIANGITNVADVQCAVLTVLEKLKKEGAAVPPDCTKAFWRVDADCNEDLSMIDVTILIHLTLGGTLSVELDANGDGFVDACDKAEYMCKPSFFQKVCK